MDCVGFWEITSMELYDKDDIDQEVTAYLEINKNGSGNFQFGLVSGFIDGEFLKERFEFTWDGQDECDEASGSGWLKVTNETALVGSIKFHGGDKSTLEAKRKTK